MIRARRSRPGLPAERARAAVCAVLIERAFHRESSAFVYPAALGFVIAATDLNITYLSGSIEIAPLVEGGALLGAGVIADRLRRRLGARPLAMGPLAALTWLGQSRRRDEWAVDRRTEAPGP